MSKYPFGEYAEQYMELMRGIYADETWRNRQRRYKRMDQKVRELRAKNMISTMSPKNMTEEDVRTYILYCKDKVSPTDLVHEINALKKLLLYLNNPAVDVCLNRNPGLRPSIKGARRKSSMQDETYDMILKRANEVPADDFVLVRAYALVLMCITTGTRNKEIRLATIDDVDTRSWIFDIVHVKGEASYGQPRQVPIHPDVRPILTRYLVLRQKFMVDNFLDSPALFPSNSKRSEGFMCTNSIIRIKDTVQEDLHIKFDLRTCRRTFGQRYLDSDLDIESVSVLMGHASTKTTEGFYSRKRNTQALRKAELTWNALQEQ